MSQSGVHLVRRNAVRLAAIGQNGWLYATDEFDRQRYAQISEIAAELLAEFSERSTEDLRMEIGRDSGYATPKVDVRGAVIDADQRVLLMRERSDGLWSLPGGWADPGETAAEAVVREVFEETGYRSSVVKLAACWDRDRHGHVPLLPVHVYKLFFLCEVVGTQQPPQTTETLSTGWFDLNHLPALSPGRVTEAQLQRMLQHRASPELPTDFD